MLKKGYQWRCAALLGLVCGISLAGQAVAASAVQVRVGCGAWSTEQVSQIEARIRAALLLEDLGARLVLIRCESDAVEVEVESTAGRLVRPVTRGPESLEDSIVQAVDQALRDLQKPPAAAPSEPTPPAAPAPSTAPVVSSPPAAATPQPTASARAASEALPAPSPAARRWLEASVSAQGERWSAHNAVGANAGASWGGERLRYGVELGGLAALGEPAGFDVNEWHAGARLSLGLFSGIRGHLGLGGSLFLTAPDGLNVDTPTSLSAAFVELGLSRPFWLGQLAWSPELAVRASSAERQVRVNEVQQLLLPVLCPAARLSLLWRPD